MDMIYLANKIVLNYILISYQYLKMEIPPPPKKKMYRFSFERKIEMSDSTGLLLP